MVSREIWEKHALMSFSKTQIELVLRTRAILYVFEKLTRACFSQIALETILLPILIIYTEMILDCDWSISVQLIANRSAKSVTRVQNL